MLALCKFDKLQWKVYKFEINKKYLFLLSTQQNKFPSLNVAMFDLQAPYFRGKCIVECTTVSYFRNYQKRNVKKLKPSGGRAP